MSRNSLDTRYGIVLWIKKIVFYYTSIGILVPKRQYTGNNVLCILGFGIMNTFLSVYVGPLVKYKFITQKGLNTTEIKFIACGKIIAT